MGRPCPKGTVIRILYDYEYTKQGGGSYATDAVPVFVVYILNFRLG